MSRFRLVTFDVTNTLLRFRTSPGEQYASVAYEYGIRADPTQLTAAFARCWTQLNAQHPNFGRHTSGLPTSKHWWTRLVRDTFTAAGRPLDGHQLVAIADRLFRLYSTEACWVVTPGAHETLQTLLHGSRTLGIISNFDDRLQSVLGHTGLERYFDFVLGSYDARCYKPQGRIFELALGRCGDRPAGPTEALHIGDDVHLDYLGAKAAGWNSLLLSGDKLHVDVDPSHVVEDITDVIRFIVQ